MSPVVPIENKMSKISKSSNDSYFSDQEFEHLSDELYKSIASSEQSFNDKELFELDENMPFDF